MAQWQQRFRDHFRPVDLAVFLCAFAVSFVQYAFHAFGDYGGGATTPDALGLGLIAVSTVPLLWRRTHPWVAMASAGAGGIALVACGYSVHVPAPLFVALYTFAARVTAPSSSSEGIWAPIGFAALLFGAQIAVQVAVIPLSVADYVIPALLLIGSWILGDRQHTASLRRVEAREQIGREERLAVAEERTRIARDLHDSVGHAINTVLVQAGAARVLRERDPERSWEAIDVIEHVARETIEDIDRIVGSLRADGSVERAPLPGFERIPDLVAQQRRAGFAVELREQDDDWRAPPPAVGRAAYRIAKEALTNAARHGSGRTELTIHHCVDRLEMTVINPRAAGPAPARKGGGHGLIGMRERAQLLGGSLEAGPVDGNFRVHAVLPYGWVRE